MEAAALQKWRTDGIRKIKKGLWSEEDAVGFKDGVTMEQAFTEMKEVFGMGLHANQLLQKPMSITS